MRGIVVIWSLLFPAVIVAAEATFTKKPTATKVGEKVKIEFAVDRETDVSVFIEGDDGRVIRHLVSGVLGKNAPKPLTAGLSQSVEWDGKADWGRPAPAGSFKARVAIGLGAKYDKVIASDPMVQGTLQNMAAGPDGTLYAVISGPKIAHFDNQRLVALNRDGSYQRTLIPPPSSATKEQLEALGAVPVQVGERNVPICLRVQQRRNTAFLSADGVAVTPSGQFLALNFEEFAAGAVPRIGLVDTTNEKAPPPFQGAALMPGSPKAGLASIYRSHIAVSSDGKFAFVVGLSDQRQVSADKPRQWSAVYRAKLPERSPAEPFFGDAEKTGNDTTHLGGAPHGIASDGKGNLLICDPANARVVVVSEADGKFAGSFPAENVEFVAADAKSGAVYVAKLGKSGLDIVKLSGWKDPRPLSSTHLNAPRSWSTWRFAVDASASPAVIWAGTEVNLLRMEDLGDKFGEAKTIGTDDTRDYVSMTIDHYRTDPEIYVRKGCNEGWVRFNEKTEKLERINATEFYNSAGAGLEIGPDGNLYIQRWPFFLFKCDRDGKALKWDEPFVYPPGITPYSKPPADNAIYDHVCMVYMAHTQGIRSDGHIFFFESPKAERGPKALVEVLPSGKRAGSKPLIWEASDSVVGPKFDQAGNIYVAEVFRPLDRLIPPEFSAVTGPLTAKSEWSTQNPKSEIATIYGSIIKFSPAGGTIAVNGAKPLPYEGQPQLDSSLKTIEGAYCRGGKDWRAMDSIKITGAEWAHFGMSHIDHTDCNCENSRFDVDSFGRVWYPDLGRYRVGVLDTNGNEICTFGGYGNADSCGADSPVIDPKTRMVRPRRTDDPKDLKSPFAEPEIAFTWLNGVGATDRYAYMGDALNRRLLRAKLVYAAEESCPIK